jgi:hypothetical protein
MAFQFEEDEAIEFGDREAVLIYHFRFWIRKNKANNHNFFDGRTWTWNKNDAFAKLFRFWSKDQIRRLIDNLVDKGVIIKGNYNSNPHDRTCWYAFTDEARFLREAPSKQDRTDLANLPNANGENAKSISQNSQIDLAELENPIGKFANYKETDLKPDLNPNEKTPDLSVNEIKKMIAEKIKEAEFSKQSFEGEAKKSLWKPSDIYQSLDDAALMRAKKEAPGWDILYLAGIYANNLNNGTHKEPNSIRAAFPVWCGKYTINKMLKLR